MIDRPGGEPSFQEQKNSIHQQLIAQGLPVVDLGHQFLDPVPQPFFVITDQLKYFLFVLAGLCADLAEVAAFEVQLALPPDPEIKKSQYFLSWAGNMPQELLQVGKPVLAGLVKLSHPQPPL